jgi:hypothetical protein
MDMAKESQKKDTPKKEFPFVLDGETIYLVDTGKYDPCMCIPAKVIGRMGSRMLVKTPSESIRILRPWDFGTSAFVGRTDTDAAMEEIRKEWLSDGKAAEESPEEELEA